MSDNLDYTLVDRSLFPPQNISPLSLENLLQPDNPAEGLLTAGDWLVLAEQLRLSLRECDVARLIFEGNTRFQIGRRLH